MACRGEKGGRCADVRSDGVRPVHVVFGTPLPPGVGLDEVREAVRVLGESFREESRNGAGEPAAFARAH